MAVARGFPYTVYSSNQVAGVANRRANLVNPAAIFQDAQVPGGKQLLNRAAFGEPTSGNGNLGRNSLGGPGLFNIDISLDRAIPLRRLGESGRLHFRADAFNFLNHANLSNPDTTQLNATTFGKITSASAPRVIELGLRFAF